jgi:TRAP-type C4-dicarboxylate transport system substrate-binding protein
MGVLLANARWMDSLAPAERAVYDKGYGDVAESRRRVRTAVSTLLLALPKQGVSLYEPTPEERESWRAAARPSYEKLVKQAGGASARIYAALLEGKQAWRQAARG